MSATSTSKRSYTKTVVALLLIFLGVLAVKYTPTAGASPDDISVIQGPNCQTLKWGLYQQRTVCDTPMQPDGSWRRKRTVWQQAGSRPAQCRWMDRPYSYAGSRWECTEATSWPIRIDAQETYIVTAETVLPDEPGHLG